MFANVSPASTTKSPTATAGLAQAAPDGGAERRPYDTGERYESLVGGATCVRAGGPLIDCVRCLKGFYSE